VAWQSQFHGGRLKDTRLATPGDFF